MKLYPIELLNGVKPYEGTFDSPVRVNVDGDGVATLQGLLIVPKTGLVGRLPANARPRKNILAVGITGDAGRTVRVDIYSSGEIHILGTTEQGYVSLSGISFLTKLTKISTATAVSLIQSKFGNADGSNSLKAVYDHTDGDIYSIQLASFGSTGTATYDWFNVNAYTAAYTSQSKGLKGNLYS